VLSCEDKDLDGFICLDDLRICFIKLKLNLNTNDIETMLNYFGLENEEKVKIEDFSRNFMAHLNETVNF
jgi:Ca2+-binding EF-hand superfamily protein